MRFNAKRVCAPVVAPLISAVVVLFSSVAWAQSPAGTPPDLGLWAGTAGAGVALTSGNSDTFNLNLAFDMTRDPKTRNLMKWAGLFIRGQQNESLVANRLSLAFRDQDELSDRRANGFLVGFV